jgi:hypothetical protein
MSRIPLLLLAAALLAIAPGAGAFMCIPIYGNWCGIDYPPRGTLPPPVDPYDAACMRHDICTGDSGDDTACDLHFISELHALASQFGYLPRSLQWAEYAIRVKAGGPRGGMPMPSIVDAFGAFGSLTAPCW